MLVVVTENGWSNIIYDFADKFNSMFASAMFFDSFYLLVKFIILSLLTGLVWEIFTIISSNISKSNNVQGKGDLQDSNKSLVSENSHLDGDLSLNDEIDPFRLMNIKDENLIFFRRKLNDTKKDSLKQNEVSMIRDDYSFDNKNESQNQSYGYSYLE